MNTLNWDAKGIQVRIERAIDRLVEMKDSEFDRAVLTGMVMTNINQDLGVRGPWTPIDITPDMKTEADRRRAVRTCAVPVPSIV
jgi:hypothetical protein